MATPIQDMSVLETPASTIPPTEHLHGSNFREAVMQAAEEALSKCGGPMQYLESKLTGQPKVEKYMAWLWDQFPPSETKALQTNLPFPMHDDAPAVSPGLVHIAMLSFRANSTPKEPTRTKTALELIESYLMDTFLTKHEPLLLHTGGITGIHEHATWGAAPAWQPVVDVDVGLNFIPPFSIRHHKAAARTSSLHLLLYLLFEDGMEMRNNHPTLWQSIREIHAYDMAFTSAKEEVFSSFRMSCRGSIRRPPNVLTWCITLQKLKTSGEADVSNIMKQWNSQSTKNHALVGAKSTSVKNLLELADAKVLDAILECVSRHGWENSPFSEDSFGTRKMFPGQHWRIGGKAWTDRCVITPESCLSMVLHIIAVHGSCPPAARRKSSKSDMEARAQTAAVVTALAREATAAGLAWQDVDTHWVQPWIRGDSKVEMEVQSALADRSNNFCIRDIPIMQQLFDNKGASSNAFICIEEEQVKKQCHELEASTFELTMKKLEYDCAAWHIYKEKVEKWEHRLRAKCLEWNTRRHEQALIAVKEFWKAHVVIVPPSDHARVPSEFNELKHGMKRQHQINDFMDIAFVNWVSPCMIRSEHLEHQATWISQVLSANPNSIAPILFPQFSYKKGQLYLSERLVVDLLSRRAINFDTKWAIIFSSRPDARDGRPLLYDGRVGLPHQTDSNYIFKDSTLLRGCTAPASMLPARGLQQIEDISETALPASTDQDAMPKGAGKFAQVGTDAMVKMLESLLSGVAADCRTGILFWEINLGWGNLLDALLAKPGLVPQGCPWGYFAAADDITQHEWMEKTKVQHMVELFMQGELTIPGHKPLPTDMPNDLLLEAPPLPTLSILGITSAPGASTKPSVGSSSGTHKVQTVTVPDNVVKAWHQHADYGPTFRTFLESFTEKVGACQVVVPVATNGPASMPPTAPAPPTDTTSPSKRRKLMDNRIKTWEELPTGELSSAPFEQKNVKACVKAFVGNYIFIINESAEEMVLPVGCIVAGFGKGKFKGKEELSEDDNNEQKIVEYKLTDSTTNILLNQKMTTVGTAVGEKVTSDPQCHITYHTKTEEPNKGADHFSLTVKRQIVFLMANDQSTDKQMSFACGLPRHIWQQDGICTIAWAVRWCPHLGLMPVRPFVVLTEDILLKAGEVFQISPAPGGASTQLQGGV